MGDTGVGAACTSAGCMYVAGVDPVCIGVVCMGAVCSDVVVCSGFLAYSPLMATFLCFTSVDATS